MLEVTSRRGGIDMGLYRKKPVVVEAVRLAEKTTIKTLEGTMTAESGNVNCSLRMASSIDNYDFLSSVILGSRERRAFLRTLTPTEERSLRRAIGLVEGDLCWRSQLRRA